MNPAAGAGSNPLAGGSSATSAPANPHAGGPGTPTPASNGAQAGGQAANPHAGGPAASDQAPNAGASQANPDDAPVSADVFREKARSEAALRKRVQELEARFQAQEDAKLSETERQNKRLQDLESERNAWHVERQQMRLQSLLESYARDKNLHSASVARTILMDEFSDQISYDDDGIPENVPYLLDRVLEKYPWLVKPPETPPPPNSGRNANPPRTTTGQFAPPNTAAATGSVGYRPSTRPAPAPGQPSGTNTGAQPGQPGYTPPAQWPTLGDIAWSREPEQR